MAEFKEFELRFKLKSRFKYGWFHLKLYQMFQDLSRRLNLNRVLADLNRGLNSLNSLNSRTDYIISFNNLMRIAEQIIYLVLII